MFTNCFTGFNEYFIANRLKAISLYLGLKHCLQEIYMYIRKCAFKRNHFKFKVN